MNILVTGSSGRIGSAVASALRSGHDVTGLDLVPGLQTDCVGNLLDRSLVKRCVAGVDAVVHCAAFHAPHVGVVSDAQFRRTNVDGTAGLLDAAHRFGVTRFVLTSSTSVYGDAMCAPDRATWVDETLEPVPRDVYDRTKLDAEALCRDAAAKQLTVAILRMSRSFPEPADAIAIYRLYRGVDARDVAHAHERALVAPVNASLTVNVSAPSPFRRTDLDALFVDAAAVIRRYHPWAPAEFARRGWTLPTRIDRVYVIDRAQRELGYAPQYDFASLFGREPPGSRELG